MCIVYHGTEGFLYGEFDDFSRVWSMDLISASIPHPLPNNVFADPLAPETGTFKFVRKCIEDKGFYGTKRYFGDLSKTVSLPSFTFHYDLVTLFSHHTGVCFAVEKYRIQYTFCCSDRGIRLCTQGCRKQWFQWHGIFSLIVCIFLLQFVLYWAKIYTTNLYYLTCAFTV